MNGNIHSIESMGLVDGPGIRMVVFMQGCNLRCKYCHNPDTWECNDGRKMTVDEIVKKAKRFKNYFGTEGGVTFSGGEPLVQDKFLLACLKACKKENINVCLDTAGFGNGDYEEILENTDLVIFDIKHYKKEDYKKITGREIEESKRFLHVVVNKNIPIWIRHVVVPGITDEKKHLEGLKECVSKIPGVERVELLPYHRDGENKYKKMGIEYKLEGTPIMDVAKTKKLEEELFSREVKVYE